MCICADDKKERHPLNPRRTKTYTTGLAHAITTYAREQMPPSYRRFAYRHKKCPDAMQSDRTRCPMVYVKILVHRKYANSFLKSDTPAEIFLFFMLK